MNTNDIDKDTRQWIDDMVVELRLRDVTGAAIGDAVASVESHCADSGETPREAFGDPREYASSLTFAEDDLTGDSVREWGAVMAPVVVCLLGFSAVTGSVAATLQSERVALTWGGVASTAFLVIAVALVVRFLRALLAQPGGVRVGADLLEVTRQRPGGPGAARVRGGPRSGVGSVRIGHRFSSRVDR